jgi:ubiquinone/menaquinone biosynthesis C-methylase UbiE
MLEPKTNLYSKLVNGGMRLFFHLLYHSFAWSYDPVASAVSFGRWNEWVYAAMPLLRGPGVLELGCGPGHLQARMTREGLSPSGLDESWQMLRQARKRLNRSGAQGRLVRGRAQHLPFAGAVFDGVVATFPTLCIVEPETLREVQRVLKPGGRRVVLWAAWITGQTLRERMLRALYRVTNESPTETVDLVRFVQPFQEAGFRASLRFVEKPGVRLMFILASKT